MRYWKQGIVVFFWILLVAGYITYASIHKLNPLKALSVTAAWLSDNPLGVRIFVGIYALRPLILFPASLLTLASGALYGPMWGTLYAVIGSNLGASLAYLLGKFLGQDILQSNQTLQSYIDGMRKNSFETIFFMRLIFLPYDLVNYVAGFLKIRYTPFILSTILGSLPGTISFVLFGASSGLDKGTPKFDWRIFVVSVLIFVASLVISRLLKRRQVANVN